MIKNNKKIILISILVGLVLTLVSFKYELYHYHANFSGGPVSNITPLIQINYPYIEFDLQDDYGGTLCNGYSYDAKYLGFPAPVVAYENPGYGCVEFEYLRFYPLAFIFNWAFYSALVGSGVLGYKKIKNRNLKS